MKEPNLPLKKKYFYRFLVTNNALFAYLQYFKFEDLTFERENWIHWMSFTRMSKYPNKIKGSLTWGITKEGYDYWQELRDKWVTYLIANNYFKINEK